MMHRRFFRAAAAAAALLTSTVVLAPAAGAATWRHDGLRVTDSSVTLTLPDNPLPTGAGSCVAPHPPYNDCGYGVIDATVTGFSGLTPGYYWGGYPRLTAELRFQARYTCAGVWGHRVLTAELDTQPLWNHPTGQALDPSTSEMSTGFQFPLSPGLCPSGSAVTVQSARVSGIRLLVDGGDTNSSATLRLYGTYWLSD